METLALIQMIFRLGATAVVTIDKAHGDRVAGAGKRVLAKDWLQGATAGALSLLPGDKAALALAASEAADEAIDAGYALVKNAGLLAKVAAEAKAAAAAGTQIEADKEKPAGLSFVGQSTLENTFPPAQDPAAFLGQTQTS